MPNFPSPYLMRDWKVVAATYDTLAFSTTATGEFLPLIHVKPVGVNYPELQPILLDTYVGSAGNGNQAEAINIIPALVGASLVGIDKSNQNGINWVEKSKDFFNQSNGQLIYLNGYLATSGSDWWYDLMPNVFFYQLYSQYPDTPDFESQLISVANRWLSAVSAMGGSTTPWSIPEMNHRGWYMSTMTPNDSGVIEPEASGAIAWLLYHAYTVTGDQKYLTGAQLAVDFLSALNSNPSYELQLPYGALVVAKMNAELGTKYPLEKIINWCFDRGDLRGWGAIVGKWNGNDVSGLIGEANDTGNDYAFAMNGYQLAAALVPLAKYDKRFARDIAKWALNMANASRLYYPKFLPETDQDDYGWSIQHDAQSVIAYEALKEVYGGTALYGTGDAKREEWAQTNLGVYGSSHVGYLAAIVESTDVDGILTLDVNSTDFFGENVFPSYLIYNPYADTRRVTLPLGLQSYDIYDAISETVMLTNVTGEIGVDVSGSEVALLVYLPASAITQKKDGRLYLGDDVVDYHVDYNFEGKLRIKSLAVVDTMIEFGEQITVFATIENAVGPVVYTWYIGDNPVSTSSLADFTFTAPGIEGTYSVLLQVTSGGNTAMDSIMLTVVENVLRPPVISGFYGDKIWYAAGDLAGIVCQAHSTEAGKLTYTWKLPEGVLVDQIDSMIHWTTPLSEGLFVVDCVVTDSHGLQDSLQYDVLVKAVGGSVAEPWAYYPLDGDVMDFSGNGHHAVLQGAVPAVDQRGEQNKAYTFSSGSDLIYVMNEPGLNFQDQMTVSFWIRLDVVPQESFILSHGSWEERWKISATPDRRLRWTIKTSSGTRDLDSSFPLELNRYYHVTAVYSGYSMELYSDGILDTFKPATGLLGVTSKELTFGKKDMSTTNYFLRGSLDEVRIFAEALAPDEIESLKSLWNITTDVLDEGPAGITLYPNPSAGTVTIVGAGDVKRVEVSDMAGRKLTPSFLHNHDRSEINVDLGTLVGLVILKIETTTSICYRKIWIR
jgi:hypothetical protein